MLLLFRGWLLGSLISVPGDPRYFRIGESATDEFQTPEAGKAGP